MKQILRNFLIWLPLAVGGSGAAVAGVETWQAVDGVVPAAGFVVNLESRMESLAFYNAVYLASEGAETRMGWTGGFNGSCNRGTTSKVFQDDVRRRVNYYRAMCGLPADITFDGATAPNDGPVGSPSVAAGALKSTCAQAAAYMHGFSNIFFDAYALTHNPTSSTSICFNSLGWNGSWHSNLTLGYFGPRAVDVYIADEEPGDALDNNKNVGHRRWILYSRARDMATGDIPPGNFVDASGSYPVQPANALYVTGGFRPAEEAPRQFVCWPPAGYVPRPLLPQRWSISFPGAVFPTSAASITMTGPGGVPVPVTLLSANQSNAGDPTLVFLPGNLPLSATGDSTCTVTVTGISGNGVPSTHTWQTHVFDPSVLDVNQSVNGPVRPPRSGAAYDFTPAPLAGNYQVMVSKPGEIGNWIEDGEAAQPSVIPQKTGTYPLLQGYGSLSGISFTPRGSRSFHLCFPYDSSEADYLPHQQGFELGPEFIPSGTSQISFVEHFRWLFNNNRLSLELSSDGGNRWTEIYGRAGNFAYNPGGNYSSTGWDTVWTPRAISLAPWQDQPIRLRFVLRPNRLSFDGPDIHHGCYLDDILLTQVRRIEADRGTTLAETRFRLDSQSAGEPLQSGTDYLLRVRPEIGSRLMGFSSPLAVIPALPRGFELAWPDLADQPLGDQDGDGIANLLEYAFQSDPSQATSMPNLPQPTLDSQFLKLQFLVPAGVADVEYGAEYTPDLKEWFPVPDAGSSGLRTFQVPVVPGENRFLRLKVSQQAL